MALTISTLLASGSNQTSNRKKEKCLLFVDEKELLVAICIYALSLNSASFWFLVEANEKSDAHLSFPHMILRKILLLLTNGMNFYVNRLFIRLL